MCEDDMGGENRREWLRNVIFVPLSRYTFIIIHKRVELIFNKF